VNASKAIETATSRDNTIMCSFPIINWLRDAGANSGTNWRKPAAQG
jgi:hypothetical protein